MPSKDTSITNNNEQQKDDPVDNELEEMQKRLASL